MSSILWLMLWLAVPQARPAPQARAAISGKVVRVTAANERPELGDARVELDPGNVVTFTRAGSFAFGNLAPGRYTISVTRDGFVPVEDRQRGITPSGLTVTLAAGQNLKDIVLPMIPAPVIVGKVIDPHGKPLAAALVRAYQRQYTPYGTSLKVARKGMTNDLGDFRLFGLKFGEYFVSAGFGDRDRAAAIGKTQLSANVSRADDGYATVFYDGGEDISRAKPAHLAPGSDPGALNFYLTESARYRIRGQVIPPVNGIKIILAPKGSDLTESDYFTQPNANGGFEIRGVSPGSYVLLATADDGALSSDVIAIGVLDNDIDGVRLTLQETMTVAGGLTLDGNPRTDLSALRVKLVRSTPEFDQTIEALPTADGAFTLDAVAPQAEYDLAIESLPPGTYVRSIMSGSRSVLSGKSRLQAGLPLRIGLSVAPESLEVRVMKGSEPAPGVQVVLVPEASLRRRADRYITGFTTQSGDLRLNVPPGDYTAYAFEQIPPGAYYAFAYSPAAESRFRDRAVSLTVEERGTKAIQLKVISAAETAGGFQ